MRSLVLIILSCALFTYSCTKMRVQSDSSFETAKKTTPYLTSQTNYQRNTIAHEQIKPPLSLLWDEEYISLPNRGFTAFENFLIFGSYRGHIVFVDMQNGKLLGKENYGDSCPVPPTIYGNILYQPFEAGSYGLVAYDFVEGDDLWEVENLLSNSSPVVLENMVYHLSMNGILSCYHYRTGELLWQHNIKSMIKSSLAFENNTLIAATITGNIFAFEHTSGSLLWQSKIDAPVFADPVIAGDRVYIGGYDGSLTSFNIHTGAILMKKNFSAPLYVSPTVDRVNIYVPVSDGKLIVFDENTLAHIWSFSAKGPPADAVLVSDEFVYLTSLEKRFYILDRMNGNVRQEIKLDGRPRSTPFITGGRLFISCEDNRILAYAAKNDSI